MLWQQMKQTCHRSHPTAQMEMNRPHPVETGRQRHETSTPVELLWKNEESQGKDAC